MSKIILEGNVTGTAAFTLKAPATSNNRTLTLPDITGTLATGEQTSVPIGSVIYHTGTTAPAGYVIANGQYLNRTTYADFWAYAQTSGNLVADASWTASKYSSGDLSTTFRVPNIVSDSVITCIRAYNTISDTAVLNAGTLVSEVNDHIGDKNQHTGYNYIINGNFDIWQRGTSQTAGGFGSDDRWHNANAGSYINNSRQIFPVGGRFPDGKLYPLYYSRTVVSSVVGTGNYAIKIQSIEETRRLAGRKVMLSFYAKADASKNMAIEIVQGFGTGGSPSPSIVGIGATKIALDTIWKRFVVPFELPSVEGKTFGSNDNSSHALHLWFDGGSTFDSRTGALGHQSGVFDVACVSLVEGDKDIKPITRSYGEELALCQRYYEVGSKCGIFSGGVIAGVSYFYGSTFKVIKRAVPIMTVISESEAGFTGSAISPTPTIHGFTEMRTATTTDNQGYFLSTYKADAEL